MYPKRALQLSHPLADSLPHSGLVQLLFDEVAFFVGKQAVTPEDRGVFSLVPVRSKIRQAASSPALACASS